MKMEVEECLKKTKSNHHSGPLAGRGQAMQPPIGALTPVFSGLARVVQKSGEFFERRERKGLAEGAEGTAKKTATLLNPSAPLWLSLLRPSRSLCVLCVQNSPLSEVGERGFNRVH